MDHICSMMDPSWSTIQLRHSIVLIFEVSKDLIFSITSLMNSCSCLLPGVITSLDDWITSSQMSMPINRGAWSEDNHDSGRMEWWSSSVEPHRRNIKLITKLDSPAVLENLVGPGLVGDDKARSKESAIINRSLLIEEWKGKNGSHKLSLMLKSSVMRRTLLTLTSVSLRYFKAECNESE